MDSKHLLAALGIVSTLLAASALAPAANGAVAAYAPPPAAPSGDARDVVTVTTKDYTLDVHTPPGWQGDTETAKKYQGSVIFTPKTASPDDAKILVSVHHKFDENTELRMQGEIANYRKRYPHLELTDLDIKHPKYATFAKLFAQPGDFYQYIAFLNPGEVYTDTLYVAMIKQKVPATPEDLAAYKDILQSLKITLLSHTPHP